MPTALRTMNAASRTRTPRLIMSSPPAGPTGRRRSRVRRRGRSSSDRPGTPSVRPYSESLNSPRLIRLPRSRSGSALRSMQTGLSASASVRHCRFRSASRLALCSTLAHAALVRLPLRRHRCTALSTWPGSGRLMSGSPMPFSRFAKSRSSSHRRVGEVAFDDVVGCLGEGEADQQVEAGAELVTGLVQPVEDRVEVLEDLEHVFLARVDHAGPDPAELLQRTQHVDQLVVLVGEDVDGRSDRVERVTYRLLLRVQGRGQVVHRLQRVDDVGLLVIQRADDALERAEEGLEPVLATRHHQVRLPGDGAELGHPAATQAGTRARRAPPRPPGCGR